MKFIPNATMKRKLIFVFVLLIIFPITVTSAISYYNYKKAFKENTSMYSTHVADSVVDSIEQYIEDMKQISAVTSYLPELQSALIECNQTSFAKKLLIVRYEI